MLDDSLKAEIQQAYSQLVSQDGLSPRYGQKLMIAEVARTLGDIALDENGDRTGPPGICVVEAGTGTGVRGGAIVEAALRDDKDDSSHGTSRMSTPGPIVRRLVAGD